MARLDNWQNNLSQLIEEARDKPFDFPTHNCFLWACSAVKAVNGMDLAAPYDGLRSTKTKAKAALRRIDDVQTCEQFFVKHLGEAKSIAFARHGDIVLAEVDTAELELGTDISLFGPIPGICYGSISYFVGANGLISLNTLGLGRAIWVS